MTPGRSAVLAGASFAVCLVLPLPVLSSTGPDRVLVASYALLAGGLFAAVAAAGRPFVRPRWTALTADPRFAVEGSAGLHHWTPTLVVIVGGRTVADGRSTGRVTVATRELVLDPDWRRAHADLAVALATVLEASPADRPARTALPGVGSGSGPGAASVGPRPRSPDRDPGTTGGPGRAGLDADPGAGTD